MPYPQPTKLLPVSREAVFLLPKNEALQKTTTTSHNAHNLQHQVAWLFSMVVFKESRFSCRSRLLQNACVTCVWLVRWMYVCFPGYGVQMKSAVEIYATQYKMSQPSLVLCLLVCASRDTGSIFGWGYPTVRNPHNKKIASSSSSRWVVVTRSWTIGN